jgi:hypothetical protein
MVGPNQFRFWRGVLIWLGGFGSRFGTPLTTSGEWRTVLYVVCVCDPGEQCRLVHFLVGSHSQQKDGLCSLILDELEDESEVIAGATRPASLQFSL